jgi:excinuclease UvrABC helicase subunit UvrB
MTIAKFNEDGTFTPLEKREFSSDEEMRAMRDEMLNRAFSKKNKKLEDMSISELEVEREKAVETQDFELAGAIRNLIEQKKSL